MTVENATYLDTLNAANPSDTELISEADDHLRLIKRVLKNTFIEFGDGLTGTINATEVETNHLTGLLSNIQDQIDAIGNGKVPIGGVMPYTGTFANIPANYSICDGSSGTPNLTDRFVFGANDNIDNGTVGGTANATVPSHTHSYSHTHTATSNSRGYHRHSWEMQNNRGSTGGSFRPRASNSGTVFNQFTSYGAAHGHTVVDFSISANTPQVGISATGRNNPPYMKLAYIMRVS